MNQPRRIASLVFAAWLVSACAHPTSPPPDAPGDSAPYELSGTVTSRDFDYADRVGGFVLEGAEDYEVHDLGFRLRYRASEIPDLLADVFVYPIALPELVSLSDILEVENSNLEVQIGLVAETRGQKADLVSTQVYAPRDGGILRPGLLGYREITGKNRTLRSYSFLTINENLFFKVRMTLVDSEETRERDPIRPFLEQLSQTLKARNTPRRNLEIVVTLTTTEIASAGRSCVIAAWLFYGLSIFESLDSGEYLDTLQRESSARRRALDFWEKESAKPDTDCESPAFAALSRAREADLFAEYVWKAYRRSYWISPRALDMDRFEAWADSEMPEHDPIRNPGIIVRWKD